MLQKGNILAVQSLLLDSLSPIQTNRFWLALKNDHLTVAATILGFVVPKLIVSTNLEMVAGGNS